MSTIKSSSEHLTLNADGASKDIKFQANGVEKASISSTGAFTSTTIDATKLTGDLPAISGASLTGISGIPSGVILMWSGASSAIPSGWNLCDGNNGTPNLTGKFIKSATTAGGTGGSTSTGAHTLTVAEMPGHNHSYSNAGQVAGWGANGVNARNTTNDNIWTVYTNHTGGSGSHSHTLEPVYYALIYIMKA
jgi:hypothetical protein